MVWVVCLKDGKVVDHNGGFLLFNFNDGNIGRRKRGRGSRRKGRLNVLVLGFVVRVVVVVVVVVGVGVILKARFRQTSLQSFFVRTQKVFKKTLKLTVVVVKTFVLVAVVVDVAIVVVVVNVVVIVNVAVIVIFVVVRHSGVREKIGLQHRNVHVSLVLSQKSEACVAVREKSGDRGRGRWTK